MPLAGSQLNRIHSTIIAASNRDELKYAVRTCMDLSFDDYAPDKGFAVQLWELIEWAARHDRLKDLVRCAHENNAGNVELAALWNEAQTWDWTLPPASPAAGDVFGNVIIGGEPQGSSNIADLEPKPGEPETVYIAGGACRIGRDAGEGVPALESPMASVVLPPYRIGRFPITNAEYHRFVRATGYAVAIEMGWTLAPVGKQPPPGKEHHPIVGITWDDALAYCGWLKAQTGRNYRLPSEAEWECAARGPDTLLYPWGNKFDASRCNALPANLGATTAVGTYSPAGDSQHHCVDMSGNVWEWTNTLWGRDFNAAEFSFPYDASDGRENSVALAPYRELRICRGGSFADPPERVTCTCRARYAANSRNDRRGFRIAFSS
jgi:formylglycine-generating enzyme required for sulfatase activity